MLCKFFLRIVQLFSSQDHSISPFSKTASALLKALPPVFKTLSRLFKTLPPFLKLNKMVRFNNDQRVSYNTRYRKNTRRNRRYPRNPLPVSNFSFGNHREYPIQQQNQAVPSPNPPNPHGNVVLPRYPGHHHHAGKFSSRFAFSQAESASPADYASIYPANAALAPIMVQNRVVPLNRGMKDYLREDSRIEDNSPFVEEEPLKKTPAKDPWLSLRKPEPPIALREVISDIKAQLDLNHYAAMEPLFREEIEERIRLKWVSIKKFVDKVYDSDFETYSRDVAREIENRTEKWLEWTETVTQTKMYEYGPGPWRPTRSVLFTDLEALRNFPPLGEELQVVHDFSTFIPGLGATHS